MAARASHWVNEEIRRFRASGRGHRIFCLLVASTLGEQLSLRALSFKGEAVGAPLTQAWPAGSSLKDFSPDRAGGAGLLVERAGALAWIEGGKSSPVSALPSPYALCRDRDDRPLVRGGGDRLGARPLR